MNVIAGAASKVDLDRALSPVERQVVDGGFVTKKHLIAISAAAAKGNFVVSFRDTGALALRWLDRGAATKPHTILEKTLKSARVPESLRQGVADSGLQGLAAHWEDGRPVGVFVTREAAAQWKGAGGPQVRPDDHGNFYIPIDFSYARDGNLRALKAQPNWEKAVITGDYDAHDMLMMKGAGGPHSVVSESTEEAFVREAVNTAVAAVDPHRAGLEHLVVRHGPQVNYPAFAMSRERMRDKLVSAVAHPSLPLAVCDRGNWRIVNTREELANLYESSHARMKVTWHAGEGHTHFASLGNGLVGIRHADRPTQPRASAAKAPLGFWG
ncbi:hypothetical protein C0Z20_18980 [Trinickia symbiotica]|uniref:Uncharacterized protein n=1 Tax=Trinickia symbiotica TaxID=863227 RepID=A0A2N7X0Q7_9BURK|nr:hypothetical protein C0Z20_18980 [Trinickia symbiotica]